MKVSVLVPVFNGERYLTECLESVLAQDFSDFEVVIADDSSTDSSADIVKRFASRDSRIVWWKNSQNLGLTANSNACLKAAKGDYIKFIHQDDKFLSPSAIRKMAAALDANPGASLAGCRQHFTRTDPNSKLEPHIFSDVSGSFNGQRVIISCLERDANLIGSPSLTLFRQSKARRGFDERFTQYMDQEMWWHLLEQGDYVYLAETLVTWRLHAKQQTTLTYGVARSEELLMLQTYYEKPWLQTAATPRMLFVQSRSLKKKYGRPAADLTRKMRGSLRQSDFLILWLERKLRKMIRWTDKSLKRSPDKSGGRVDAGLF